GSAVVGDISGRLHRRLCNADDARRNLIGQTPKQVLIEFEGREVAGVYPDDTRAEVDRTAHLVGVVRLNESGHAELIDEVMKLLHALLLKGRSDEQHEVGASGARLEHLIRLSDEVFTQNRDA